jgi:D-sorbitol dehydrogenase-like protein
MIRFDRPMHSLSRRTFLTLATIVAPVGRLRAALQPTADVSPEAFLRLSRRLTGRSTLDAEISDVYRRAFLAIPANGPLLAQLTRVTTTPTAAHLALERDIIECWYTGTYMLNGERRLATHAGALMWSALNVPAAGSCVGAFGAWSRKP